MDALLVFNDVLVPWNRVFLTTMWRRQTACIQ
jgi:aromatic ring hydroxylase